MLSQDGPLTEGACSSAALADIEARTQRLGRAIFDRLQVDRPSMLRRQWWDDRIMAWAMDDAMLKVQLFRFVDVLPMLSTDAAVAEHLHEYLSEVELPGPIRTALRVARRSKLGRAALARMARLGARDHARRFIAGSNVDEVVAAARRERELGRGFTLDILGEAVTSETEAEGYFRAYIDLLERVSPKVYDWPENPRIDQGPGGQLPRMNLSIKLSALDSQFDALDFDGTTERVATRLRALLRVARAQQAFVNVDMESFATKGVTLHVFKTVLMEDEFRDTSHVGIVIQCYLRDAQHDLHGLKQWAEQRGTPVWVRLVKGAYWDYETIRAESQGWPIPVYQVKSQSDANFEDATRFLLTNRGWLRPALGTHNIRSLAHALAVAQHLGLSSNALELQMLYGMADPEKAALFDMGFSVRVYMPYGELIPGMAYLVRRLLENTANDSFLRASFVDRVAHDKLLRNPREVVAEESREATLPADDEAVGSREAAKTRATDEETASMNEAMPRINWAARFRNQPPIDFAGEKNRQRMRAALDGVRHRLGNHEGLYIGGRWQRTDDQLASINPSDKQQVVGTVSMASREDVGAAVAAAVAALPDWAALPGAARAEFLKKAAEAMRKELFELAAWEVYECGKGWREATNDVCEAIDFCEYYALGAEALQGPRGVDVPGEENRFGYLPRGVVAVIAPWNFPLAILTGMTVAALVTGNTVVMKPAEQSPIVAKQLMDIFHQLGLPAGVLNYLPGRGEVAGAALVEHPDVALIAFTGSRQVGLRINAKAAEVSPRAKLVKRVIAEMGGKNAIIVDSDADLDEAVVGVVKSAFGYQGQKCSACSRTIVLEPVYEAFLQRLVEATRSLRIGPADDPATSIGPVIDLASWTKIRDYIQTGRGEGRAALAVDAGTLADRGFFIGPHIFADVAPTARIAQEEVFGPVLAVIRASSLDDAIQIANGTDYALTGGIYSRSPANLDRARRQLMAGNLYLNHAITGALVGRQPFGGFRMSGIGSKAGGPDYLLQFVVPRTVTENTMRRGFAPS